MAQLADEYGVSVVRGDTTDVLSRFLLALDGRDVDAVARFTSDCPLMDPAVASMVVAAWRSAPDTDHVSTVSPRCLPRGMDAEVASVRALRALDDRLNEAVTRTTGHTSRARCTPTLIPIGSRESSCTRAPMTSA